ncbi:hypothetical protein B0H17DRAFT_1150882 [Mycena rosella]|uniref:Uncharacterized protein n=1 Tax=Mycena rosella TaxID=1033263 RepID=A0AAD7BP26_MYCRO|nr:hypothetical protein B0H17DRAFT_1150882 [Mycena rosella]
MASARGSRASRTSSPAEERANAPGANNASDMMAGRGGLVMGSPPNTRKHAAARLARPGLDSFTSASSILWLSSGYSLLLWLHPDPRTRVAQPCVRRPDFSRSESSTHLAGTVFSFSGAGPSLVHALVLLRRRALRRQITFTNTRAPAPSPSSATPAPTHVYGGHKRNTHLISSVPLACLPTSPGTPQMRTAAPLPPPAARNARPGRKGLIGRTTASPEPASASMPASAPPASASGSLPALVELRRKKMPAKSLSATANGEFSGVRTVGI